MTTDRRALTIAAGVFLLCIGVGGWVACNDQPAKSAAANAVKPTEPQPGPPVPQRTKPVEEAPPLEDTVTDGSWVIGKEIKRGTYRTAGRVGCYWARLQSTATGRWYRVEQLIQPGQQVVALAKEDVAFETQGCAPWELVTR